MTVQGIPLRPDFNAARNAAMSALSRAALASCLAALDRTIQVDKLIDKNWGDRTAQMILRAAVSPTTTATTELAQVTVAFLAALVPVSAGAVLLSKGMQLNFNRSATINCPSLAVGPAAFVGEGAPIPVISGLSKAGPKLEAYKLAAIAALTGEMIRGSNAEAIVRQALIDSTGPALDAALFSNAAGVPDVRPPGLLNGVAPIAATAGGGDAAMLKDISALAAAIAPYAGNSDVTFIASLAQAVALGIRANNFNYTLLSSSALPPGTIVAVVNRAVASVLEAPSVLASQSSATLHMEDTAPADIGGGVMATPVKSMYQTDSVALRLTQPASWALREKGAAAWIQNVTW
jgi:hypothetical protein